MIVTYSRTHADA